MVNLFGTAAVARAALPYLKASHGRIVTVASTLGIKAVGDATAYCASKFGVVGFTRSLAAETAGQIGVTLLIPGGMHTHFFDEPGRRSTSRAPTPCSTGRRTPPPRSSSRCRSPPAARSASSSSPARSRPPGPDPAGADPSAAPRQRGLTGSGRGGGAAQATPAARRRRRPPGSLQPRLAVSGQDGGDVERGHGVERVEGDPRRRSSPRARPPAGPAGRCTGRG